MRECATCKRQFGDDVASCPDDETPLTPVGTLIGRIIDGRYRIESLLGTGGMGSVYRATQLNLDRTVAVKVISASLADPASFDRFKREAMVVARLRHPNIVSVYDFGANVDVGAYIVMEYLPGTPLHAEIRRRGPLPVDEAVEIAWQACDAVAEAHAAGIIHRDIKPQNILLEPAREGVRVKVLDFGIAKLCEGASADGASLTKSGAFLGTPSYMAPEQWLGDAVDSRADIYSLGCVLYEMLAGRPPFVHASTVKLLRMHTERTPAPPGEYRSGIGPLLDLAVLKALAKSPDDRYQSAAELARALEPATTMDAETAEGRPARPALPAVSTPRRQRAPLVGREAEMAELVARLDAAAAGECQFVLVSGAAGVGKTRLLDELEDVARERGIRTLHGHFAETDQALSYDGFFEVIREHLRTRSTAAGTLNDLMPDLLTLFPMLADVDLGRTPPTLSRSTLTHLESGASESGTSVFETLANTLTRVAGGRALAIHLEDLHAANVSVEALQYAVRRLVTTPVLVVATFRDDEVDKRHPVARLLGSFRGDRRFAHVELAPLPERAHRELVEQFLGGDTEDDLTGRLFQVSEGNPYFAIELVRALLESGDLTGDGGEWHLATGAGLLADALPETVQEAVRQRINELPERAREVLANAAVLGREFDYVDLEALAGDVEDVVDQLVECGLVEEDRRSRGDRLVFTSGVIREVTYASIPKRKRRALHRRHAEGLERRFEGRLERVLPALVSHYVHADAADKVFEYGTHVIRRSLEAHAADEAQRVATTMLEFAREEGEIEIEAEVRVLLGDAQRMRGQIGSAVQEYEAAVKAFQQAGRNDRALAAMEHAADSAWEGRRTTQAARWVEAGIAAARLAGATDSLARLLSLGATIANLGGDYDRARAYSQEADSLRPAVEPDEDPIVEGGRLVVAITSEVRARSPVTLRFAHEYEALANAFEPLLTWDARGGIVPRLALAWDSIDGGRAFVFTLRDDVRLHDDRLLTADLVKQSLERAAREAGRSLPSALAAISGVDEVVDSTAAELSGVEVLSEREVRIQLKEPLPIYPALLTDPRAAIAAAQTGDQPLPAGTGPFVVRSIDATSTILERHERYWGEPAIVDSIEFRVVPDSSDRAAGVRSGEYDIVRGLEPGDLDALLQARPVRTTLVESPIKTTAFLLFNASSRIASTPGVARALTGVLRVHDLVRGTLGRFAQPAEGLLPPGILGHDPGRRHQAMLASAATSTLEHAGLDGRTLLRASISPASQSRYGPLLEALFAEWAALGVDVSVETPTLADNLESLEAAADFDFTLQEWEADYDDPDTFTYALFHSQAGLFARFYSSAELDRLIEQARSEPRTTAREGLYRRIEQHLLDTGLFLPLFHRVDYRVAGASVRRLTLESAPPFVNYSRIGKAAGARPAARPGRVALHIPLPSDFDSIDPCVVTSVAAIEPSLAVFETLVRPNAEARVVPWLASEFRQEDRGRRYVFRLRDDVRFHDGRRLTARDVRFSFERLLRSKGDYDQLLFPVKGAERFAADEADELDGFRIQSSSEFEIELSRPLSILPALLTCGAAAIVPDGTDRAAGTWQSGCVGTGPFRVAYAGSSGRLELEANPFYWRRGYPQSERLSFTAENDSAARAAGFRDGKFSVAWLLARADEDALLRDPEHGARGVRVPEIATTLLVLNAKRGPLSDEMTRRRFASAFDVEGFVRRVEGPSAVPAHGLIPPGLLGHDPQAAAEVPTVFDESNATVKVTVSMTPPLRTAWGNEFVRWLGERGFVARIVTDTYAEHEEAISAGAIDIAATGWNFDYPDADSIVYGALHSSGRFGREFIASAEIDRLADLGRMETDQEARRAIYRETEEIVARRAHAIPLYYQRRWFFPGPGVEGIELNLFQPYLSYEKLFIRE